MYEYFVKEDQKLRLIINSDAKTKRMISFDRSRLADAWA